MNNPARLPAAQELDERYEPELAELRESYGRAYSIAAFRYRGRTVWYAAPRDASEDDDVLEADSPEDLKQLMRADHETRRRP
jgi:hypothetical protein